MHWGEHARTPSERLGARSHQLTTCTLAIDILLQIGYVVVNFVVMKCAHLVTCQCTAMRSDLNVLVFFFKVSLIIVGQTKAIST